MAKLTLNDILGQYASSAALNVNFDLVETAFENTLSRDGTSPNYMEADFDLNSNDLLNARTVNANDLYLNGERIVATGATTVDIGYTRVSTKAAAAALTLTSANDGDKVFITSADGGEFTVKYNATPGTYADDGGSYCGTQFIPTGGDGTIGLIRDYDGPINVLWFGATGDGSTDDTTAIQTAIDVGSHGSTIYFPQSEYVISTLTVDNIGQELVGEFCGTMSRNHAKNETTIYGVFLNSSTTTGDVITFHNASYNINNCGMRNMLVKATTSGYMVNQNGAAKFRYDNVFLYNDGTGDGIKCYDSWITSWYNCFIEKGDTNVRTGTGVEITNSGQGGLYNFINTTLYQWLTSALVGEQSATPTGQVQNFNFIGSQSKSSGTGLEFAGGVEAAIVQGSYIEGHTVRGFRLWYGASNITIDSNYINDPGTGAESILVGQGGGTAAQKQFSNIRVTNNNISNIDSTGTGVRVTSDTTVPPECVLIEDNYFDGEASSSGTAINLGGQAGVVRLGQNKYGSNLATEISSADLALCAYYNYNGNIRYLTQHPAQEPNVETLSAAKSLTSTDALYQFIDTGATGRTVRMPAEADSYGRMYFIKNVGATTNVTIKDDSATTTIATLTPSDAAFVICDATAGTWHGHII